MTRRKGERTRRGIDRDFPHQVEIAVPPGGLGRALDRMHDVALGIGPYATRGGDPGARRRTGVDVVRFCFAERDAAERFQAMFGGAILTAA